MSSRSLSAAEERKKAFFRQVFHQSSRSGHVTCHFCKETIWAPNSKCNSYSSSSNNTAPHHPIQTHPPFPMPTAFLLNTRADSCFSPVSLLEKHHLDKCRILKERRVTAEKENLKLLSIGGVEILEEFLPPIFKPAPRRAKHDGFVMSSSALLDDPNRAPSDIDGNGRQRTGKKGYTRCVYCNAETYAPNTSRHECSKRRKKQS